MWNDLMLFLFKMMDFDWAETNPLIKERNEHQLWKDRGLEPRDLHEQELRA